MCRALGSCVWGRARRVNLRGCCRKLHKHLARVCKRAAEPRARRARGCCGERAHSFQALLGRSLSQRAEHSAPRAARCVRTLQHSREAKKHSSSAYKAVHRAARTPSIKGMHGFVRRCRACFLLNVDASEPSRSGVRRGRYDELKGSAAMECAACAEYFAGLVVTPCGALTLEPALLDAAPFSTFAEARARERERELQFMAGNICGSGWTKRPGHTMCALHTSPIPVEVRAGLRPHARPINVPTIYFACAELSVAALSLAAVCAQYDCAFPGHGPGRCAHTCSREGRQVGLAGPCSGGARLRSSSRMHTCSCKGRQPGLRFFAAGPLSLDTAAV